MHTRFWTPRLRRAARASLFCGLVGVTPGIAHAVTAEPGWIAGTVALPAVNAADVASAGSSFLVGIGPIGVGTQSIVRVDRDGTATTLVTGLNAIGGIDFDRAGNRLVFTDNGLETPPGGATTGDTLYALPDPLGASGAVAASTLELAPEGSIDSAQAIVALEGGDILVGDPLGFGAGRVVRYSGGILTDLIPDLDYTAGLAISLTPAGEILVGDVNSDTFAGTIDRYDPFGGFVENVTSGLLGIYDMEFDRAGNLLLTGDFAPGFSESLVASIAPNGDRTEVASGFAFSSGLEIDGPSQQALVLDFGAAHIDTLTPIAALSAGGSSRRECQLELWGGQFDVSPSGRAKKTWSCADGSACDRDNTVDGICTFVVGACFSVADARVPLCTPEAVDGVTVLIKGKPVTAAAIQAAAGAILPSAAAVCSNAVEVTSPVRKTTRVKVNALSAGRPLDSDSVGLRCRPAV